MDKKYLRYSSEQLLDDKVFVEWIVHGKNSREWQEFHEKHPEFLPVESEARQMVQLLQEDYFRLDEQSVFQLWENIQQFDEQHNQNVRKLKIKRVYQVAASFMILISLGILGYYYLNKNDQEYLFSENVNETTNARMVLHTGREIPLNEENSTVTLNNVNDELVINDSVFNLTEYAVTGKMELPMNELIVPFGKRSEVQLSDGTRVWLNSGSRLAFPSKFLGDNRVVFLEGEACFQVAHNNRQPFIVKTEDVNIEVLGTYFNVAAYRVEKRVETVLIEGSLALTRSKSSILKREEVILKPSQKAEFLMDANEFLVSEEKDAHMYIAWINGWLTYEKKNLASVLRELERYYNIKIVLPEDYPVDDKITGKLDLKESLEDVLNTLADASGFNFKIEENQVIVEEPAPN
jgi:transmembrane sensor